MVVVKGQEGLSWKGLLTKAENEQLALLKGIGHRPEWWITGMGLGLWLRVKAEKGKTL
jgi:hypothetical protein